MEFGVVLNGSYSSETILHAAKTADEVGLNYLFITDHYMTPVGNSRIDAWIALGAIAAVTKSIRLGTCVTPIPFRPPAQLAKIVASVDQISRGRAILGVGSGWHAPEFSAYSSWDEDGRVRARKTREGLRLILALWDKKNSGNVNFSGKYYTAKEAVLDPKPVQNPTIPLWFGTQGEYMLKVAARMAQGWLPGVPGIELGDYHRVISALREEEKKIGRAKDRVKVACNGTIQELSKQLGDYEKVGCEVALLARSEEKKIFHDIKTLAKELAPSH